MRSSKHKVNGSKRIKEHQDADDDEDWEDVSMSDRDRELFLHGKLYLTEPVRGWRRLVILMLTCQSQVATEVAIAQCASNSTRPVGIGSVTDASSATMGADFSQPRPHPASCRSGTS